jgi:acetoin utilization deacetylase AcuC-like enzyme
LPTAIYTHPACLEHDTGRGHPEQASRLSAILTALKGERFAGVVRREARRASIEEIALVHPRDWVEALLSRIPKQGYARIDPDTVVSPASGEAALRAAGAVCGAVDAIMAGEIDNAFCAVRPPGHHAEPRRAMGFCLFNNVAIGAFHARCRHGLERVAVVDFDVHHGNGTQAAFYNDPTLFYGSSHQWPLYPGTGAREERGVGNIVNVPLEPFTGSAEFRLAIGDELLPALDAFAPELILLSAGFDAHALDPLANLNLVESDFAWITEKVAELARRHAKGRLVSALEGGYDLGALAGSAIAHVGALMAAAAVAPRLGAA